VKTELPLPHPLAREYEVGDLLDVLVGSTSGAGKGTVDPQARRKQA